jgi:predicted acylesterase/phospholipase RssA
MPLVPPKYVDSRAVLRVLLLPVPSDAGLVSAGAVRDPLLQHAAQGVWYAWKEPAMDNGNPPGGRNGPLVADLVLEGGGVKGIGLVGAVSALHDKGYHLGGPGRVAGTSAGAIVGSLVAAGMPVPQMVKVMQELDYRRFRDGGPLGRFGRGLSLFTGLGLYRGDYLHRWISEQLEGCGVRTFGDLRLRDSGSSLPQERAYKLVVVVSDVTSGHMARLPWD